MVKDSPHFKYVDALRGIAILLVMLHHCHPSFSGITNHFLPPVVETVVQNGDKGVTLFFLMSAYTLSLSLHYKSQSEEKPIRNYFIRRFFRIAPLYTFAVAVVILAKINNPSLASIIANIFLLHGLNANWINSTVPGGWSVGTEVLFYIVFPFIFFRVQSLLAAVNALVITLLIAKIITGIMMRYPFANDTGIWGNFVYENLISQLPVFLLGICLFKAKWFKHGEVHPGQLNKICFTIAALIIIYLLGGNIFKTHYLFAIAFALAVYALSNFDWKPITNWFTIWIGQISYSLYLVHLLVINLLVKYHLNLYNDNPLLDMAIRFIIILTISVPIAYTTYRFIEIPSQRIGKRIITKLELPIV